MFRAAKYLGIAADRLAKLPRSWRDAATVAEQAESEGRSDIRKREEKKGRMAKRKGRRG